MRCRMVDDCQICDLDEKADLKERRRSKRATLIDVGKFADATSAVTGL